MKNGGIFQGPTALGIGLGATMSSCTSDNVALVKKVQAYLQQHGAPNLKIDGQWQGCTASAFRKVMGAYYVTADHIKQMTGETCSSDDALFGGVLPGFTLAGANVCMDGSDGASTPGGGGAVPTQQCAAGQVWNDLFKTCVPDIGGGAQPPAQSGCPAGQVGYPPFCMPGPGGTTQGQPTECASGQVKNPIDGKCYSPTNPTGQPPTECPSGQTKLPFIGTCVPVSLPTGQTTSSGQCPAGQFNVPFIGCMTNPIGGEVGTAKTACPEGQMNAPLIGCIPNPFATVGGAAPGGDIFGGLMTTIGNLFTGGGAVNCPPGSVYNAATKGCMSPSGPVAPVPGGTPGVLPTEPGTSVFGGSTGLIVGVLAIGVLGAVYWVYKKNQAGDASAMSDDDLMAMQMAAGMEDLGEGAMFGDEFSLNRRRGKKSRRRGRRSRRRR